MDTENLVRNTELLACAVAERSTVAEESIRDCIEPLLNPIPACTGRFPKIFGIRTCRGEAICPLAGIKRSDGRDRGRIGGGAWFPAPSGFEVRSRRMGPVPIQRADHRSLDAWHQQTRRSGGFRSLSHECGRRVRSSTVR